MWLRCAQNSPETMPCPWICGLLLASQAPQTAVVRALTFETPWDWRSLETVFSKHRWTQNHLCRVLTMQIPEPVPDSNSAGLSWGQEWAFSRASQGDGEQRFLVFLLDAASPGSGDLGGGPHLCQGSTTLNCFRNETEGPIDQNKWHRTRPLEFVVLDHSQQEEVVQQWLPKNHPSVAVALSSIQNVFVFWNNCPVFHALKGLELQDSAHQIPGNWVLAEALCLPPTGTLDSSEGSPLTALHSFQGHLDHALGEKQLLSWILTDCSSRSGNLNFYFAIRWWPFPVLIQ